MNRPNGSGGGQPAGMTMGGALRGLLKAYLGGAVGGAAGGASGAQLGGQIGGAMGQGGNQTFAQPKQMTGLEYMQTQTQPDQPFNIQQQQQPILKLNPAYDVWGGGY